MFRSSVAEHKSIPSNSAITQLLNYVAQGKQAEAEMMIKANSALLLQKGEVTDYSLRTFKRITNSIQSGITAFHYTLWALDYHMWKMILNYLPAKEAINQMHEFFDAGGVEYQQTTIKQELHYDFDELIHVLKTYHAVYQDYYDKNIDNPACEDKYVISCDQVRISWLKVGVAQRNVPAHIASEWCSDRLRNFYDPQWDRDDKIELPRTTSLSTFEAFSWLPLGHNPNQSWFPLSDRVNERLGVDFAVGSNGEILYKPAYGRGPGSGDYVIGIKISMIDELKCHRKEGLNTLKSLLLSKVVSSKSGLLNTWNSYHSIAYAFNFISALGDNHDVWQTGDGRTYLIIATQQNYHAVVHDLVQAKRCNLNHQDKVGFSALMVAAINGYIKIAYTLITSYNCNLNLRVKKSKNTALTWAAIKNHSYIAYMLITAGADVNLVNTQGKTALDYAMQHKNLFISGLLLTRGAQFSQNPAVFLNLLSSGDQRNPHLLACLGALCKQQQLFHEAKFVEREARMLDEKIYKKTKKYITRLNQLSTNFSSRAYIAIRDSTKEINNRNGIPREVLKLICEYDAPLEGNRVRFFKADQILTVAEVEDKTKAFCAIM